MKLLNVSTVENARQELSKVIEKLPRHIEARPITECRNCVLAQDIVTPADVPAFRKSTVDGYAVVAADTHGATETIPVFLDIAGEVHIGDAPDFDVKRGQCAYVPTGAMLPEGADAMVMVEYCDLFDESSVAVNKSVAVGSSVVNPGDDMKKDTVVMKSGRRLRFQEIGALSALGITHVDVYSPYTVSIISTGDELVEPGTHAEYGQVYESNSKAVSVQAETVGMKVIRRMIVPDDENLLRTAVSEAMKDSDFVITSGGSSQGKKDMTEAMFAEMSGGGVYIHGLALKPGKPTILAWDDKSKTAMIGLPGHPVAASIVFRMLVTEALKRTGNGPYGEYCEAAASVKAEMTVNLASAPGRDTVQSVRLIKSGTGFKAEPILGHSGSWSVLTGADGYIFIDHNEEGVSAGTTVDVFLLED
jgi:molybdopterin molybdotransferase